MLVQSPGSSPSDTKAYLVMPGQLPADRGCFPLSLNILEDLNIFQINNKIMKLQSVYQ